MPSYQVMWIIVPAHSHPCHHHMSYKDCTTPNHLQNLRFTVPRDHLQWLPIRQCTTFKIATLHSKFTPKDVYQRISANPALPILGNSGESPTSFCNTKTSHHTSVPVLVQTLDQDLQPCHRDQVVWNSLHDVNRTPELTLERLHRLD